MSEQTKLFRSPTDAPIHLALTNGHAAVIGPEPRELPPFMHRDAVAAGALVSIDAIEIEGELKAPPPEPLEDRVEAAIKEMLGRGVKGDFTQAGFPNLNALALIVGEQVPKELAYSVFSKLRVQAELAETPPGEQPA